MKHTRLNCWLGVVLTLAVVEPAWGQSVHVVAGDGSGDFLQLQGAVTAAANGDVILVRPHTERYIDTTIDNKALTIVGDGAVRPAVEDLRVTNLGPNKVVSLRFLDIEGRSEPVLFGPTQYDGLELTSNAGCVWLEDVVIAGANGIAKFGGSEAGFRGLVVGSSSCVVVVDSEVRGGFGSASVGGTTYPGGDGGLLTSSRIALHGCTFV